MIRAPPRSTRTYTLFPYTTLFRSTVGAASAQEGQGLTLDKPAKIAMLYIRPRNDGGWTQAFDEARQKLETELDTKIQYVESVPENAFSIRPAVDRLIQRGANVLIGTAFGYSDTFKELAAKYPDVAFLHGSGTPHSSNLDSPKEKRTSGGK